MTFTFDEIRSAVHSSGYLFEQEVMRTLEELNFKVKINFGYKDLETGISREIDLLGLKYNSSNDPIDITIKVIIECKKIEAPLVFLTRYLWHIPDAFLERTHYTGLDDTKIKITRLDNNEQVDTSLTQFLKLFQANSTGNQWNYYSTQFCKIIRDKKRIVATHGEIYNSYILPLIKAVEFFKYKDKQKAKTSSLQLNFYYPILVVNGDIYSLDSRRKNAKPKFVDHVIFRRSYESSDISGIYFIDVVKSSYLHQFLKDNLLFRMNKFYQYVSLFKKEINALEIIYKDLDEEITREFEPLR